MIRAYLLLLTLPALSAISAHADVLGDFSRANCINNESISFYPTANYFKRVVVSGHYNEGG